MTGGIRRSWIGLLAVAMLAMGAGTLSAQEPTERRVERLQQQVEELRRALAARDTTAIEELRRQIDAITREIEAMKLGSEVAVEADTSMHGLSPAASKVYRVRHGVSVGGYGEMLYQNFDRERQDGAASGRPDQFDALRAILYVGYKFNDKLLVNTELEWEHGSTSQGGEASIEFAYIDYRLSPAFGLRGGLLLAPMGLVNELHEPPTFVGSTRPLVESAVIPTTWRANGVGFFGEAGDFSYRAYAMTSLDAVGGGSSKAGGFSAAGLRGGRQKGTNEMAEDFSLVGRVDYTGVLGLMVGASAMVGETGHGRVVNGRELGARATIWEAHADYKAHGLELRGLYAAATVDDAALLNAARNLAGDKSVGERLTGSYVQAGYDVLRTLGTTHQLLPYVRYETLNTQARVPAGFSASAANDRTALLLGAMWKPIAQVAVKADYQIHGSAAETGVNQFNVNLSYLF